MLCEGHCIARRLRGSGGGVWPHDARTVAEYRNGILAHGGCLEIVNHLNKWLGRGVDKLGEHGWQVLFSALPQGGDVALPNLACGNRGAVCSAIGIEQEVWKLALLIGVPIPDPVESPRTGLQLAVLAGNQVTQEMKVTRLKHRETPGQSLHDLCRGQ